MTPAVTKSFKMEGKPTKGLILFFTLKQCTVDISADGGITSPVRC